MSDDTENEGGPQGGETSRDTDYEALELLADIDPAEAAELTAYKAALMLKQERAGALARVADPSAEET